jgi:hypothetical protein
MTSCVFATPMSARVVLASVRDSASVFSNSPHLFSAEPANDRLAMLFPSAQLRAQW